MNYFTSLGLLMKDSFQLLNRNLYIFIIELILLFIPNDSGWLLISPLFLLGWIGTKVALFRDSRLKRKSTVRAFGMYMWKYLKRFFVLIPLGFVFTIIFVLVFAMLVGKYAVGHNLPITEELVRDVIPSFASQLTNLSSMAIFLVTGALLAPYVYSFIPIIVLKDISLFRGVKETFLFLIKNKKFYLFLLILGLADILLNRVFGLGPEELASTYLNRGSQCYAMAITSIYVGLLVQCAVINYFLDRRRYSNLFSRSLSSAG